MVWYGLGVALVAIRYRRVLGVGTVAVLAGLMVLHLPLAALLLVGRKAALPVFGEISALVLRRLRGVPRLKTRSSCGIKTSTLRFA